LLGRPTGPIQISEHVSGAETEYERQKSRSALQPISVTLAPRSVPAPRPFAPRSAPQLRSIV